MSLSLSLSENIAKFEVWSWYGFGDGDMFLKSESYEI